MSWLSPPGVASGIRAGAVGYTRRCRGCAASTSTSCRGARRAAIERAAERRAEEVELVRIVRGDDGARVVRLPAGEIAIVVDDAPVGAAVVGAPQLTVVGGLPVHGHAVARLDERVHAIGIRASEGDADLADVVRGETVAAQTSPGGSAVGGHIDAGAGPAALASPRVNLELPRRREELLRVGGIHHDVDAAGVLVDEEHLLPRAAAVRRAIDAALALRSVAVALRGDEDDVGIRRDRSRCGRRVPSRRAPSSSTCGRRRWTCRRRCRSRCGCESTARRCRPRRCSDSTARRRARRSTRRPCRRRWAPSECRRRPSSRCRRTRRRRNRC